MIRDLTLEDKQSISYKSKLGRTGKTRGQDDATSAYITLIRKQDICELTSENEWNK